MRHGRICIDIPARPAGMRPRDRGAHLAAQARRIATPHVRRLPTTPEQMERLVAEVHDAARASRIAVDVLPGGELDLAYAESLDDETCAASASAAIRACCCSSFHTSAGRSGLPDLVFRLRVRGFTVVLAHPERNADVQERPERLRELVETGAWIQLTAASVDGRLGQAQRGGGESAARRGARAPDRERRARAGDSRNRHGRGSGGCRRRAACVGGSRTRCQGRCSQGRAAATSGSRQRQTASPVGATRLAHHGRAEALSRPRRDRSRARGGRAARGRRERRDEAPPRRPRDGAARHGQARLPRPRRPLRADPAALPGRAHRRGRRASRRHRRRRPARRRSRAAASRRFRSTRSRCSRASARRCPTPSTGSPTSSSATASAISTC